MKLISNVIRFLFLYLILLVSQQVMAQKFDFGEILKQAVQGALINSAGKQDVPVQTNIQTPDISNAKESINQPIGLRERGLFAGNDLITSFPWPTDIEKLGFKSIILGDEFNLQGSFVHAYTTERDSYFQNGKPFSCQFNDPKPIAICKVTIWSGRSFPQDIADLNTAFGVPVKMNFMVLLSKVPTVADIAANKFGRGRIFSIEIRNSASDQAFIDRVMEFFTKKYNIQPTIVKTFKKPAEIYSAGCLESNNRIAKIPTINLSLNDKNELKRCDAEATNAIFSGKAFAGSNSTYKWQLSDKFYVVTLTSSETRISTGNGGYVMSSNNAQITIQPSADAQIQAYNVKLMNIIDEQAVKEEKSKKGDF